MMRAPRGDGLLERMAMISFKIAPRLTPQVAPEVRTMIEEARAAFADAYAQLDSVSQAWLLSVIPQIGSGVSEGTEPVFAMARKSENRLVQLAYLMFQTNGARDPMLDAAMRSEDPVVRRLGELIKADAEKAESSP